MEVKGRLLFSTAKAYRYGIAAVLLGVLFRAVISRFIFFQPDEEIYSYDAWSILMGNSLMEVKTRIYIGYSLSLAAWMKLFGVSFLSARMFTVFCHAGIILFSYLSCLRITKSERAAFTAALLIALLPYPLRYGHIILSEPFSWMFISLSVYLLVLGLEKNRWFLYVLSGLAVTMAASGRRSALIVPVVIVPALIWIHRDDLLRAIRSVTGWVMGFALPLVVGVLCFVFYFGIDNIKEHRWDYVPEFGEKSIYQNAFFALQPTVLKAGPLALLLVAGLFILVCALFRNRWKAVYLAAVLWPAFVQMSLDTHASNLQMVLISMSPAVMLMATGKRYLDDGRAFLAVSLLFGSSIAFNNTILTGSIWNVVIYWSAGALVLLYLEDRVSSGVMTPFFLIGGLTLLGYTLSREGQIRNLILLMAPIAGLCYSLSLPIADKLQKEAPYVFFGLGASCLIAGYFKGSMAPSGYVFAGLAVMAGIGLFFLSFMNGRRTWRVKRYFALVIGLFFYLLVPEETGALMVIIPLVLMFLLVAVSHGDLHLPRRLLPVAPILIGGGLFLSVYNSTGSLEHAGYGLVLVLSVNALMIEAGPLIRKWKQNVNEGYSIVLLMLVIGMFAFYVYYAWTEVYLTELIVPSAMVGGLLIWLLFRPYEVSQTRSIRRRIREKMLLHRRIYSRSVTPDRGAVILFMSALLISVPVSLVVFSDDNFFRQDSMDQRPLMQTIMDVADWVRKNSDKDEEVLVWHHFAVQANRRTIIEPSNAQRLNAYPVIREMEEKNVSVFVRDYYTNVVLWDGQVIFQNFIRENFRIVEIIDGNECWMRNG